MPDEDIYRQLGRIEEGISHLKESAAQRDEKLIALDNRVRENEHGRRNEAQINVAKFKRIEDSGARVEASVQAVSTNVDKIDKRVSELEAPLQVALLKRQRFNRIIIRITTSAAAAVAFCWVFLEPIYKPVADYFVRKWLNSP